ncbi:hypothetical protein ACVIM8_005771 [Bradyrhizobium sp. USDA 4529]
MVCCRRPGKAECSPARLCPISALAHHDLERVIWQCPLQRLRLVPRCVHPNVALFVRCEDHRYGLGSARHRVRRSRQETRCGPWIGFDLVPWSAPYFWSRCPRKSPGYAVSGSDILRSDLGRRCYSTGRSAQARCRSSPRGGDLRRWMPRRCVGTSRLRPLPALSSTRSSPSRFQHHEDRRDHANNADMSAMRTSASQDAGDNDLRQPLIGHPLNMKPVIWGSLEVTEAARDQGPSRGPWSRLIDADSVRNSGTDIGHAGRGKNAQWSLGKSNSYLKQREREQCSEAVDC